jgi:peroxin-19
MKNLVADLQNPEYGDSLADSLKALSGTQEGVDTLKDYTASRFKTSETKEGDEDKDVDRTVAKLLNDMGQAGATFEGMEADKVESMGGDLMESMMSEFTKLGEKEDYNQIIDGMMRQLLSRELMYDPMKQVCKIYPKWLANAKAQLSDDEYTRYGTQYQYFQRIVAVFETEPDNYPRLMELMNDIQEYGQPPSEIIKELAPGLAFNEQGMPIMPHMGNSMMPDGAGAAGGGMPGGMPGGGMPGVPLPGGDAQQCAIS